MSLKKQNVKGKSSLCRVTFSIPKGAVKSAKKVTLVGDFNNWDTHATPMKKQKDGSFSVSINLEKGREYQFRYLIDGKTWENDWVADKYVATVYGGAENSVVVV